MKKLLCIIATRMEPGLVQNIIGRLGSKSPALFVTIQKYSATVIGVLGIVIGAMETHQIPDFANENYVVYGLSFLAAIFTGIGGGASLATTDPKLIGGDVKGVIVNEANAIANAPEQAVTPAANSVVKDSLTTETQN